MSISSFDQEWHAVHVIVNHIATEVVAFYLTRSDNRNVFKLKQSVIPAYTTVYNLCTGKPSYKDMVF